jgi:hypothetical protein
MNSINIQQNKKTVIGKDIKNMVSYKILIMIMWLSNLFKIVENSLKYIICLFIWIKIITEHFFQK